jgi:hypothetical protein
MHKDIIPFLDDLERRINPDEEETLLKEWRKFADGNASSAPFHPTPRTPRPSKISWPNISINDALQDLDLMIISQLKMCHDKLCEGSSQVMVIRANYSIGIIPSMLGCRVFMMPKETNTLPNAYPLDGGVSAIRHLVEGELPKFNKGWGPQVLDVLEVFQEIQEKYPVIASYIQVDHPDCQGPLDICELLWGSDIFYALIDEPEFVHKLLRWVTDFYISFMDHWYTSLPLIDNYHADGGGLHKGAVTLRDDSLVNLSTEMYNEFALPYDRELLSRYQGGMVHFCGRGDHFIEQLCTIDNLYAIDLSQPHLNNMELIIRHTIDKGINLHIYGTYDGAGTGDHHWERFYCVA